MPSNSAIDWLTQQGGGGIPTPSFAPPPALPFTFGGDVGALPSGGPPGVSALPWRLDSGDAGLGGLPFGGGTHAAFEPWPLRQGPAALRKEQADQKQKTAQQANARQVGQQARGVRQAPPTPGGPIDFSSREAYLRTAMPYFQQIEARTGIPAESLAAISINEGATVPGTLAHDSGAPFGIKSVRQDASGNDVHTGYPVTRVNAWEVRNGQNVSEPSAFVNFPNPDAAIQGFVDFLQRNPNYAVALAAAGRGTTPQEFNALLARAGYATDPAWTSKINSIAGEAAGYRAAPPPSGPPEDPNRAVMPHTTPFAGAPYNIAFDVGLPYNVPLSGGTTHHRGVDLVPQAGGIGTTVTALAGGVVQDFRQGGDQGNAVVLQGADGLYTAYFHLADPSQFRPGDVVQPGQVVGRMGQSGSEGFPHLHLEVRRRINGDPRGSVIDPLAYYGLR